MCFRPAQKILGYKDRYRKNSDTRKICCNHPKIWTGLFYRRVIHPKDAEEIGNSVDRDQTNKKIPHKM